MKNKTCLAVLVRWDSSDIFHSLSLFSLHFSLLFLRAYFPFFLSLSPLCLFQKETIHACDTYAGTEEPIKPNYSCIRHCSSSFFYTIPVQCVYMYIYFYLSFEGDSLWTKLWTLIREIKWSTSLSLFFLHLNKDRRRIKWI